MSDALSWIDGSADAAATLLADRAVASRALGGAVAPGERPAWVGELAEKVAALDKTALEGIEDAWNQGKDWLGGQVKQQVGEITEPMRRAGSNAVTGGLLGMGVGALGGMAANALSSNPRKRPVRNALFGGLLGGLAGAGIGGAGTYMGAFGTRERGGDPTMPGGGGLGPPKPKSQLTAEMDASTRRFNDRNEVTLMKTIRGGNSLSNAELAKGVGTGALLTTGANTGVRTIGRLGAGLASRQTTALSPEQIRRMLSVGDMSHVASLSPADMAMLRSGNTTPLTGRTENIGRSLQNAKSPAAAALAGKGDTAIAKALGGAGFKHRVYDWSKGPTLLGGTGKWGLRGGTGGLLYTAAQKGLDADRSGAVSDYWKTMGNGLQQRYSGVLSRDQNLKSQLDAVLGRITSGQPMTDAETQQYGQKLQDLRQALRNAEVMPPKPAVPQGAKP